MLIAGLYEHSAVLNFCSFSQFRSMESVSAANISLVISAVSKDTYKTKDTVENFTNGHKTQLFQLIELSYYTECIFLLLQSSF